MNRSRCRIDTRTDNKEPLFQDNPGNWHQKGYTNLDFNVARDECGGSGTSWTIHKSFAPRSRQITTSAAHDSSFLQAGCSS